MSVFTRLLFVVSLVLLAGVLPAVADDPIPSVLNDEDGPLWVAADEAVDLNAKLKVEKLGRFGLSVAELARKKLPDDKKKAPSAALQGTALEGCEIFRTLIVDHFQPTASLADLTTHAETIISGRVVAMRQGFFGGTPGSLLRLSKTDTFKGESADETYLFYPIARVQTDAGLICAKPLGNFIPPAIGDRLLAFSMVPSRRIEGRTILQVNTARELVHEPRQGTLQVPAALNSVAVRGSRFDDVVQAVRESVEGARKNVP